MNTHFLTRKCSGLSAEVSFGWESDSHVGIFLDRPAGRPGGCSWMVRCQGLGTDAGVDLKESSPSWSCSAITDARVTWSKWNCIWIPHQWITLGQRDGGEKDFFFFFSKDYSFKSSFRFTAKLKGQYEDFAHTPRPHTFIASPIINISR